LWSGHIFLFPFSEQTALYEWFMERGLNPNNVPHATGNLNTPAGFSFVIASNHPNLQAALPTLKCPSDGNASVLSQILDAHGLSRVSYVFNVGDGLWDNGRSDLAYNIPANPGGPAGNVNDNQLTDCRELFSKLINRNFGAVSDGLSNTIAMSETAVSINQNVSRDMRGAVAQNVAIWSAGITNPTACMNIARNPTRRHEFATTVGINSWRGRVFTDGRVAVAGFTTVTPPNSPKCAQNAQGDNAWGIFPPSSFHAGGVNVAWLDGSVSFLSDNIDTAG
jgi:prepilin-type processing-associated H-X9-DG protein